MDQLICDALRGQLDAEIALSPGFRWGTTTLAGQPLTMEDILAQTATTYPATYVQSMTGGQIKDVLEDVCDNLFNADPYYQQGGDMVRTGGLLYTCTPTESVGHRISELKLENGRKLESGKRYKVAGWASVNEQSGAPIWDVVAKHLRSGKPPIFTRVHVGWRTARPARRGGSAIVGRTSEAQKDGKSRTRIRRPSWSRCPTARSRSVPAQGDASVTTVSRPLADAVRSASAVRAAARRAASANALLANGIPQQSAPTPSG